MEAVNPSIDQAVLALFLVAVPVLNDLSDAAISF